jgi:hypothetical protein
MCISFILSLFLVERQDRARRNSEHPSPSNQSFWSTFTLHNWLNPEPYQDPTDTTWQDADATQGQVVHPKREKWFMRKKHRKMSKVELTEAFEMRSTVMIFLLAVACVLLVGLGWIGARVYHGLAAVFFS